MRVPRSIAPLWLIAVLSLLVVALTGCDSGSAATPTPLVPTVTPTEVVLPPTNTAVPVPTETPTPIVTPTSTPIPASERKFVPVLSYHHIREWEDYDTEDDRAYVTPPSKLEAQLEWLKENGYQSVTSEQIYQYYANGRPLPEKPIMLSFDDNIDNQYTAAYPLLQKYGFGATFFILTVTIDKDYYMTAKQLKEMAKEGFDLQLHTWDHHMVTTYETEEDWQQQAVEPVKTLQELTGYTSYYFAYPAGAYNAAAAEKLKSYGYKGAFRLVEVFDDETDPLFAIKRYVANGYWKLSQFEEVVTGEWE